jgi:hypothetical protein
MHINHLQKHNSSNRNVTYDKRTAGITRPLIERPAARAATVAGSKEMCCTAAAMLQQLEPT